MSIIQGAERRMDGRAEQGGRVTFSLGQHNPDVLTCIANLSNDEVFTPPVFAGEMLDTLADAWAEAHAGRSIWSDATVTFLDPFTKSGVFLREITKRLVDGLAEQIPDLQQRVNHILTRQVFGIGITQLTALLARRSVYCSKNATGEHSIATGFDRPWGNIWYERTEHTWVNRKRVRQANPLTGDDEVVERVSTGRCRYCGAQEKEFSRCEVLETHAYAFIHTDDISSRLVEIFGANVHFDVIIGNPPYQMKGAAGGTSAASIYQLFVEHAIDVGAQYVCMVIPSRWMAGGRGLGEFREHMLGSGNIQKLVDFTRASDVFPGIPLKGGVCYFLWNNHHQGLCDVSTVSNGTRRVQSSRSLDEFDVFIRDDRAISILRKVRGSTGESITKILSHDTPFGIPTNFKGRAQRESTDDVVIFYIANGRRTRGFISRDSVHKNSNQIDSWKLFAPKAYGAGDTTPHAILGKPVLAPPPSVCTQSYMFFSGTSEESIKSIRSYYVTKFFRFLVSLRKITQDALHSTYKWVPMQTWDRKWTDADLYAKYHLTDEEIAFIESMIRPMELDDNA
jgi:site-specific DNA-methyltransferase (adenine-specific)